VTARGAHCADHCVNAPAAGRVAAEEEPRDFSRFFELPQAIKKRGAQAELEVAVPRTSSKKDMLIA